MTDAVKIITSINPIYYAISPISMLFRGIHCIPIQKKTKCLVYNKYAELPTPCDVMFHKDNYQSFQFIQYTLTNMTNIEEKLSQWSQKHFNCPANIEYSDCCTKDFVTDIVKNTKPSGRIGHKTNLFVLSQKKNELIALLDHYYCDGIILFDLFKHLFPEININLPFPKYKYYPVISDAFACEFTVRQLHNYYIYPTLHRPKRKMRQKQYKDNTSL
jgi:hypothetical protein